jgi:hypothetical protein
MRVITGIGLFAFGYYIGKQVGRMEPVNEELSQTRHARTTDAPEDQGTQAPRNRDA